MVCVFVAGVARVAQARRSNMAAMPWHTLYTAAVDTKARAERAPLTITTSRVIAYLLLVFEKLPLEICQKCEGSLCDQSRLEIPEGQFRFMELWSGLPDAGKAAGTRKKIK